MERDMLRKLGVLEGFVIVWLSEEGYLEMF